MSWESSEHTSELSVTWGHVNVAWAQGIRYLEWTGQADPSPPIPKVCSADCGHPSIPRNCSPCQAAELILPRHGQASMHTASSQPLKCLRGLSPEITVHTFTQPHTPL
jgi:hypothetical protein